MIQKYILLLLCMFNYNYSSDLFALHLNIKADDPAITETILMFFKKSPHEVEDEFQTTLKKLGFTQDGIVIIRMAIIKKADFDTYEWDKPHRLFSAAPARNISQADLKLIKDPKTMNILKQLQINAANESVFTTVATNKLLYFPASIGNYFTMTLVFAEPLSPEMPESSILKTHFVEIETGYEYIVSLPTFYKGKAVCSSGSFDTPILCVTKRALGSTSTQAEHKKTSADSADKKE